MKTTSPTPTEQAQYKTALKTIRDAFWTDEETDAAKVDDLQEIAKAALERKTAMNLPTPEQIAEATAIYDQAFNDVLENIPSLTIRKAVIARAIEALSAARAEGARGEREACAKVAETTWATVSVGRVKIENQAEYERWHIAAAIRAREVGSE
jgi:ketopantoate reductase